MENGTTILFGLPGVAVQRVERATDDDGTAVRLVHMVTTASSAAGCLALARSRAPRSEVSNRLFAFYDWCARADVPEVTALAKDHRCVVAADPGLHRHRHHQRRHRRSRRAGRLRYRSASTCSPRAGVMPAHHCLRWKNWPRQCAARYHTVIVTQTFPDTGAALAEW